jgi:hypothetical protein
VSRDEMIAKVVETLVLDRPVEPVDIEWAAKVIDAPWGSVPPWMEFIEDSDGTRRLWHGRSTLWFKEGVPVPLSEGNKP